MVKNTVTIEVKTTFFKPNLGTWKAGVHPNIHYRTALRLIATSPDTFSIIENEGLVVSGNLETLPKITKDMVSEVVNPNTVLETENTPIKKRVKPKSTRQNK